jgi:formylglycine-generating enzyme required for sulfatase activity
VTWDEAQTYVKWLSKITGKSYRFLSEAEYEYAARAGKETTYPWGNDIRLDGKAMANCAGCGSKWDNKQTALVGSFDPNGFGLYDMVGNVSGWTQDCVHNNFNGAPTDGSAWLIGGNCNGHIIRGASWYLTPHDVRSAFRDGGSATQRGVGLGFRIAQTLVAP